MKFRMLIALCLGLFLLTACSASGTSEPTPAPPVGEVPVQPATELSEPTAALPEPEASPPPTEFQMPFELASVLIGPGQPIPAQYSCDGENLSPPLDWGEPPGGTQSFALIMDDPDAPGGTWVHWVLYNIPADVRGLQENIASEVQFPDGSQHGLNSFGQPGYGGPCPPSGIHRYFFKLYALDVALSLGENADREQVLAAMEGHVLAETELMGTYSR